MSKDSIGQEKIIKIWFTREKNLLRLIKFVSFCFIHRIYFWINFFSFFLTGLELVWIAKATTGVVWITTVCQLDTATSVAPCPWSSVRIWSRTLMLRLSSSGPGNSVRRWAVERSVAVPTGTTPTPLVRSSALDARPAPVPSAAQLPVDAWDITSVGGKSGIWPKKSWNFIRQVNFRIL